MSHFGIFNKSDLNNPEKKKKTDFEYVFWSKNYFGDVQLLCAKSKSRADMFIQLQK